MDKKVLIIAVVFCLDLGLIWLLRGNLQPEEPLFAVNLASDSPTLTSRNPSFPKPTLDVEEPVIDIRPAARPNPRSVSEPRSVGATIAYRPDKRPATVAEPKRSSPRTYAVKQPAEKFTDTIIWIKPTSFVRTDAVPAASDVAKNEVNAPRSKKRSIFSRAVPVIKKPYEWLKSLVSKL